MSELASPAQLRAAMLRWALVLIPGTLLLGTLSGGLSAGGADSAWFVALVKPETYPPPATFGIVWPILYVLMALALVLVITARGAPGRGTAIAVWAVQFLLNLAWSPLFFGAHQISNALYLLMAIDLLVLITLILFWRIRPLAGMLMVPYLAWVLFATVLNWQFLELNPIADGAAGAVSRVEI